MTPADREAFLAELLAGERSLDDPEVEARLRAEPELWTMYEHMREVEAEVARGAADIREILRDDVAADPRHTARVLAGVQQAVAEQQRTQRRRWLAAAALLVVGLGIAVGGYALFRNRPAPGDIWLGGDPDLSPQGWVDHYSTFTWKKERPPGGNFVVSIFTVEDGHKGSTLLLQSDPEKVSTWQVPADKEAALPNEIYWELEVVGGPQPEVYSAQARRRH